MLAIALVPARVGHGGSDRQRLAPTGFALPISSHSETCKCDTEVTLINQIN